MPIIVFKNPCHENIVWRHGVVINNKAVAHREMGTFAEAPGDQHAVVRQADILSGHDILKMIPAGNGSVCLNDQCAEIEQIIGAKGTLCLVYGNRFSSFTVQEITKLCAVPRERKLRVKTDDIAELAIIDTDDAVFHGKAHCHQDTAPGNADNCNNYSAQVCNHVAEDQPGIEALM